MSLVCRQDRRIVGLRQQWVSRRGKWPLDFHKIMYDGDGLSRVRRQLGQTISPAPRRVPFLLALSQERDRAEYGHAER